VRNMQYFAKVFPHPGHDHNSCVTDALKRAEAVCAYRGARLTSLRRDVLKQVWDSHNPIGAYDILNRLQRKGKTPAPITIYRTLDFLLKQGLVHRLATLNAYIGCGSAETPHDAQFLICNSCGVVAELNEPSIGQAIGHGASRADFHVNTSVVEVRGLCPGCYDN